MQFRLPLLASHSEDKNWSCSIGFFSQLPRSSRLNAATNSFFAVYKKYNNNVQQTESLKHSYKFNFIVT